MQVFFVAKKNPRQWGNDDDDYDDDGILSLGVD